MLSEEVIKIIYSGFQSPIVNVNCGEKCAPYNEQGVPFCCDTRHAIPTAYEAEWNYLRTHTDMWSLWCSPKDEKWERLYTQKPIYQVLINCKGHLKCQREYRSLTCRTFPFYPYIDQNGDFIGLAFYVEYEDRCWLISNLNGISNKYLNEFINTFDQLFRYIPDEKENFSHHAKLVRRIQGRKHRAVVLLHRNGLFYKISPKNGRKRRVQPDHLSKYGPFKIASSLPFPGEENS